MTIRDAYRYDLTARMLGDYLKDLGLTTHGCCEYSRLVGRDRAKRMALLGRERLSLGERIRRVVEEIG